jgi:hypothetical protein
MRRGEDSGEQCSLTSAVFCPRGIRTQLLSVRHRATTWCARKPLVPPLQEPRAASALANLRPPINRGKTLHLVDTALLEGLCSKGSESGSSVIFVGRRRSPKSRGTLRTFRGSNGAPSTRIKPRHSSVINGGEGG